MYDSRFPIGAKMPRALRFCRFSTFYPPYGFGADAIYVYRLANSLATQGHEVDAIHCADSYNLLARTAAGASWTEEELMAAMEQLPTNVELRCQLGDNAYRCWEQKRTEHEHLRMYFNILTDTAQRKYGDVPWAG